MVWSSPMNDSGLFAAAGPAVYVWVSYAVAFVILGGEIVFLHYRRKRARALKGVHRENAS